MRRLFRAYVVDFAMDTSAREKVLLVDRLIHNFHRHAKLDCSARPMAVNLIECRLRDVIALLDDLSYSERSTTGLREQHTEWEHSVQWACEW